MLILQDISYIHPNKDLLFSNLQLTIGNHKKVALIGNNGVGKSTLLQIIAGVLPATSGTIKTETKPYYVPQIFGQYNHLTIAQALQVEDKLNALQQILVGNVTEQNLLMLNDDWSIEERCAASLQYWQLEELDLTQKLETLSGGQKTKVFLAGITIHQPRMVLLDEPSNHLDMAGKKQLYHFVQSAAATMLVVSHDRTLLNLLDTICELSKRGIVLYGGNYDFYTERKLLESNALAEEVHSKEKTLRQAKEAEKEVAERRQKLDARGRKKQEKAGVPTIMMNTLRNSAEKSTSRLKSVHMEKIDSIYQELNDLRKELPDVDKMKFGFDHSALHKGKELFTASNINFGYGQKLLWEQPLSFQIVSGERLALKGLNGSGKTTLVKIILGLVPPGSGTVKRADNTVVYIDQEYSIIDNSLTVYQQVQLFNFSMLEEHAIKIRLTRFLFTRDGWDKPCSALSGGEKMRLTLCCLTIGNQAPDIIVLDEPTNNLDLQNVSILTAAINSYQGTVIAISHDEQFLHEINIGRTIML